MTVSSNRVMSAKELWGDQFHLDTPAKFLLTIVDTIESRHKVQKLVLPQGQASVIVARDVADQWLVSDKSSQE